MPLHYGYFEQGNIMTVGSSVASQVPHASGAGYGFRVRGDDKVAVTYFGDGGSSTGDFHAALNFAATLNSQALFICRNN